MKLFFTLLAVGICFFVAAQPKIDVVLVAEGFEEPVDITHAGDERLFIVERLGKIKILYPDTSVATFLDLTNIVGATGGEQGLLGLAFHPNYASNGYFYVNYTDFAGDTHISRFTRSLGDPEKADSTSEMNLLFMDQPASNHNGGDLNFGPDGYLYIFMGDGGGAGHNRSQDITDNKLGKILRIDVDGGSPYAIPADNPYVGIDGDDEIWAIGLRNPWRSNFDRLTGDLWIGDVGADSWEEIDFIANDTTEFMNFGWKCYEGNMLREGTLCDTIVPDFDFPVFVYPHDINTGGFAITGGFVYRGSAFPALYGKYIFCDYISGNFWTLSPDGFGGYEATFYDYVIDHITSFGENIDGEIFACINDNGNIYQVVDACQNFAATSSITHANAATINNGAIDITVSNGTAPYTFLWSNGATTQDISGLSAGTYTVDITDNIGCAITIVAEVENLCSEATGIVSTPSATSVFINWDDVGATGYRVLYKPVGPGPFSQINTPVSAINISGLNPSTPYTFKIRNKCPGAPGSFTANGNFVTLPLKIDLINEDIHVFPNPGNDVITIANAIEPTILSIYSYNGELVGTYQINGESTINISHLSNGIYQFYFQDLAIAKTIIILH